MNSTDYVIGGICVAIPIIFSAVAISVLSYFSEHNN